MKLINWVAGFFEDQQGNSSRKAVALYVALYYLKVIIEGNLNGGKVDETVLLAVVSVILFSIGAITAETLKGSDLFKRDKPKEN